MKRILLLVIFALSLGYLGWGQGVSATWGVNSNPAWYTPGNWAGGKYAGVQGAAASNSYIATFTSGATGNPIGINLNTAALNLGAISVDDTRTNALNITNSSGTAGVLRLYGATINSVNNVIIRNNGSGLLTLQTTNTMGIVLGNATENIINIDGSGGVTIASLISDLSGGAKNITKSGSGNGVLTLTNSGNTYSGTTIITSGELRLNPSSTPATFASQVVLNGGTLGTTNIAANRVMTSSSTLKLDVSSTIALGSNVHSLKFAASNGITWAGTTLTITGWTGTAGVSGTAGKIYVGTDATGLTSGQLAKISFSGYTAGAQILSTGEVVPAATNTAPTVTTQAVSSIGTTTATGNGNITATGGENPHTRGVCWVLYSNGSDPTTSDFKAEETGGSFGTGAFTESMITNLSAETRYKLRAYATNTPGTGYGSLVNFWTLSLEPSAHSTTFTNSVISQTQIDLSFDAASTITNADGYIILQKVGSAPTGTPTDGTAYSVGNIIGDGTVAALVTSNSSTTANITGLTANTSYYFAIMPYNWNGTDAGTYNYYTVATIPSTNATTWINVPTITTTNAATGINQNSATSGGTTLNANGGTISVKGVVWNTTTTPILPGLGSTSDGSGTANYVSSITGLDPQTLYYVRAYATNEGGTGYGTDVSFRTLSNPPTFQATTLSGTATSQTAINLTWIAATFPVSGATTKGYVLFRATSPNTPIMSNGNGAAPTVGANTTIVSSAITEGATSQSSAGLTANTTYNYLLIPFCWDGTNAATYNYLTASAPTASAATWPNIPTISTTNAINNISESGAASGGTTLNASGGTISIKGVVWNTTTTPVLPGLGSTNDGTGTANYTSTITGLNPQTQYYVRAYATNLGGTGYGSNINFRTYSNPPTGQATNLNGTVASSTSIDLTWTAATFPSSGATSKKYVLLRATYPNTPSLSNGNGAAPSPGANTTIVTSAIAEADVSYTVSSLAVNVKYNFLIIPFTWDGANATTYNYLTSSAPTTTRTTLAATPSAPTVATPTSNSLNVSPVLGTNPNTTEFAIYETTSSKYVQADGTLDVTAVWQTNTNWGTNTVTGLSSATTYTFQCMARNLENIETSFGASTNGTTYATEPTAQPSSLLFSNVGSTSFDVSFTAATGLPDNYLVLRRSVSAPTGTPVDGTTYTLGQTNIGTGTNTVAYVGSSTGFSESSLATGTNYYYSIYSYNGSGTTANYYTTSPLTGSQLTIPAAPTANAATTATATSFSANWTASTGASSYRLDVANDSEFTSFVSGFNDLNVSNVTTYSITGLSVASTYYYRIRAVNVSGTSSNSSPITAITNSNYYSKGSLAPNVLANWSSTSDGLGSAPTNFTTASNYIIQNGHSMTTTSTWSFGATGAVLQIQNGGTLQADHSITIASTSTFQIDNGGTYVHNNTGTPSTTIFQGTESFGANSSFEIKNWTGNTTTIPTATFGNLKITYNPTAAWNTSGTIATINGSFTIDNGSTNAFRFVGNVSHTLTIGGDLNIVSGLLQFSNAGAASNTFILNIGGSYNQTGGTFTPNVNSSSVLAINFTGSGKSFIQSAGTLTNTQINWDVNNGSTLSLLNDLPVASSRSITVNGTLDCGASSVVSGLGAFTLASGATLKTANSTGINSSITVSGAINLHAAANFEFNGSAAQVTGTFLPATVNNFTIDNAASVKLSNSSLTVSGTMTINSGKLFTLESGKQLTVSGTLTKSAEASEFVINSGASLITSSAVSATVEREIVARVPSYQGWHFISSPVASQAFQSNFVSSPPSASEDFYLWSETTNEWINSKVGSSAPYSFNTDAFTSNFIIGQGYLAAYGSTSTKSFSGTLNVANVPKTLSYSGTSGRKGWNLLGNPFTSGLTWNAETFATSNVGGIAKIIKSTDGSYEDLSANEFIPALNGFFVYTATNNNSFTIPANAKTHNGTFYKSGDIKQFELTVVDIDGHTAQTSNIRINPAATDGFDLLYDGMFAALYAPQFYSIAGDNKLSTNSLPEITNETVINFGFVKNEGNQFRIEAEDLEEFGAIAYLTDLKTGTVQNLNSNPVYSFTSAAGDQPNRFKLSFASVGIEDLAKVTPGIYTYGNNLCIENSGQATLEVYNMAGQRILVQEINSNGLYQTSLNNQTGYYIVRLTNAGQVKVSKVFIK